MNRTDGGTLGGIIGLEEWNMSDTVTFDAESRALVGKGAARAARRNGRVPAVIYGANKDPEPITIDPTQLRAARMQPGFFATLFDVAVEGGNQKVLCRDLQLHPVTDQPMHADFLRVTDSTRINVEIPVVFENEDEAPGLKGGGVLNVVRHVVEVMCRAGAIPNDIVVDLTGLDIGDSVHIASITLPDGVKPTIDRDFTIATIAAPTVAVVEDDEAEGEDEDGEGAESEGGDDSEGGEDDS
jgi:large subunit ribosomal protein L25